MEKSYYQTMKNELSRATIIFMVQELKPSELDEQKLKKLKRLCLTNGTMYNRLQKEIHNKKSIAIVFLALVNSNIVGWALLVPFKYQYGRVKHSNLDLYVRPKYRKLGVGTGLIEKAKKEAKKLGVVDILTYTWNKRSFAFFASNGMTPEHLQHCRMQYKL